jgi:hypothetical protein
MKVYGEMGLYVHVFLTSALSGQYLDSFPSRFTPVENPRYPLDWRLSRPQNRPGRRGEEKNLAPAGTRTPTSRPSIPWPVAIPTALSQLLTHKTSHKMSL